MPGWSKVFSYQTHQIKTNGNEGTIQNSIADHEGDMTPPRSSDQHVDSPEPDQIVETPNQMEEIVPFNTSNNLEDQR